MARGYPSGASPDNAKPYQERGALGLAVWPVVPPCVDQSSRPFGNRPGFVDLGYRNGMRPSDASLVSPSPPMCKAAAETARMAAIGKLEGHALALAIAPASRDSNVQ